MYELIDYLNSGPCLVLIGAGPSCEIGLPDWRSLCARLLDELRKKGDISDIEYYEVEFAQSEYAKLLGRAWRSHGPDFVLRVVGPALADTRKHGRVYDFLVRFPFCAYFTTNLDGVLRRHFDETQLAVSEFSNTKEDLEKLDIHTLNCLVKLHGDLSSLGTLVLTDAQYEDVIYDPRYEYLRAFIRGYLTTHRFLFVGYSLRDPDMQSLLQLASKILRRKVPLYAILANPSDQLREEWDRRFNIRIVPYRDNDGSHSELVQVFEILRRYVAMRGEPPLPRTTIPRGIAQSLYMWHRFQSKSGRGARRDAFKSLVLAALGGWRGPGDSFSLQELVVRVAQTAGMKVARIAPAVQEAALEMVTQGLVKQSGEGALVATHAAIELNEKYAQQFQALQQEFMKQIELDLRQLVPESTSEQVVLVQAAVIDVLSDAFSERGAEIVGMVFGGEMELRPTVSLFKTVNAKAESLPRQLKYPFILYLTKLLTNPRGVQEKYLDYLSHAFFAVQALGIDPTGTEIRRSLLSNHTLILDSNVLIPLVAVQSAHWHYFLETVSQASAAGLRLIVTPRFFDEMKQHYEWASVMVRNYGAQSMDVYEAALGRGKYKRNEFLDGFIRYCTDVRDVTFEEYLEECFGGPPLPRTAKDKLRQLGVEHFNTNEVGRRNLQFYAVKEEVVRFAMQRGQPYGSGDQLGLRDSHDLDSRDEVGPFVIDSEASTPEFRKSVDRANAEAEAFAVIFAWETVKPQSVDTSDWKCSVLSRGTFLNKVAHGGPFPLGRNVTVRPDVLYEFLGRLGVGAKPTVSFKDVLLSTYFRAAGYFIDKKKYARFFAPLLTKAEEIYSESLQRFRRLVDSSLTAESLNEVEELERPFVVSGLTEKVDETLRAEVNRLSDENYQLRKEKEAAELELRRLRSLTSKGAKRRRKR